MSSHALGCTGGRVPDPFSTHCSIPGDTLQVPATIAFGCSLWALVFAVFKHGSGNWPPKSYFSRHEHMVYQTFYYCAWLGILMLVGPVRSKCPYTVSLIYMIFTIFALGTQPPGHFRPTRVGRPALVDASRRFLLLFVLRRAVSPADRMLGPSRFRLRLCPSWVPHECDEAEAEKQPATCS